MGRNRTYVLTKAGAKARVSRRSGLPAHYRQILGLIRPAVDADEIHAAMEARYPREQVESWLDELDTLGFITLMPSGSSPEESLSDRWRLALR
jgi:hypothetical protein